MLFKKLIKQCFKTSFLRWSRARQEEKPLCTHTFFESPTTEMHAAKFPCIICLSVTTAVYLFLHFAAKDYVKNLFWGEIKQRYQVLFVTFILE